MLATKLKCFSDHLFHGRNVKRLLFTASSRFSSYNSDGQTTVSILNQEYGGALMIDSYSQIGFRLNNGLFVIGPIVIFPRSVISWNVKEDKDINEDSLSFFTNLEPKLDILVIGFGKNSLQKNQFNAQVLNILHTIKLHVEILPTEKACTTFNFLNSEQRFVAAALIPPLQVPTSGDDNFQLAYKNQLKENFDALA